VIGADAATSSKNDFVSAHREIIEPGDLFVFSTDGYYYGSWLWLNNHGVPCYGRRWIEGEMCFVLNVSKDDVLDRLKVDALFTDNAVFMFYYFIHLWQN